ncbi:hypothetical protein [Paenibacillus barcinonensis]|nr:hypothetical protein [Paenibacillus barcinonensis]
MKRTKVAIFDIDKTIICSDSMLSTIKQSYTQLEEQRSIKQK